MTTKYTYSFGDGTAEGDGTMKDALGGKGAGLAEMTNLGIPVPAGFTITTGACVEYVAAGGNVPDALRPQVAAALELLERRMGARLGDPARPLLVSVRSGAKFSMPGMMDTILNLGLNDETIEGHARRADERFAWDCYRRFVQMYGDVVLGVDKARCEHFIEQRKKQRGSKLDTELSASDWKALVAELKALVRETTGADFPQDPHAQLWGAIEAVFRSWNNPRAVSYRRLNKLPDDLGTAVNVQAMVFGNMGLDCATGVAFTRDPATGEKRFFGEWLPNAQGEDVVAGTRTPRPVARDHAGDDALEVAMPRAYARLLEIQSRLETHYRDMQDIEFTIQHGELYMLQTRTGKRTGPAAVRIAVEMVDEKLITPREAVLRVEANALEQLLKPVFRADALARARTEKRWLAKGLNAGPGAASGRIAFSAERAVEMGRTGKVVLVRVETSPEDIDGMASAEGILTARGGATSHAALVARQMGKPCVAGCGALEINHERGEMRVAGRVLREGDDLSVDGTTGDVYAGHVDTEASEITRVLVERSLPPGQAPTYQRYARLMAWADEYRRLRVRANADTPHDAAVAVAHGAEGIGLCRTEHMFFDEERIRAFREMIVARDEANRREALARILPFQREDFVGIFRAMGSRPVTIRLLDPPLHEFLPHEEKQQALLATDLGVTLDQVKVLVERLAEANPMLGHRGCRLGITYPEIYEVQVQAIVEAACLVKAEGVDVHPEIMIPLVGEVAEYNFLRERTVKVAADVMRAMGRDVAYLVGTMIEVPRAALTSGAIAQSAEFFSFGTNDLTQMTLGISRDDARFLQEYIDKRILRAEPFQTIDQVGVGRLVELSVKEGRAARPGLKIGVCGEHGGDADSVKFFHRAGLDYVSCSPYRLPTARLAAAQAALQAS
jgi:pyruvate,orthophosphate dikinase